MSSRNRRSSISWRSTKARFRRPVIPGDTVLYYVEKMRSRGKVWRFKARAVVDGNLVAEAEVSAVIVDTIEAE